MARLTSGNKDPHAKEAYGTHFAEGCHGSEKFRDVLHQMDELSRSTLIHDQLLGKLEEI